MPLLVDFVNNTIYISISCEKFPGKVFPTSWRYVNTLYRRPIEYSNESAFTSRKIDLHPRQNLARMLHASPHEFVKNKCMSTSWRRTRIEIRCWLDDTTPNGKKVVACIIRVVKKWRSWLLTIMILRYCCSLFIIFPLFF